MSATAARDLTKAIDKLVEQKTFSLDAVGAIKELRDKAAALEISLDSANATNAEHRETIRKREEEITRLNTSLAEHGRREADLLAREKQVGELEKRTAVAEAKAATGAEFFHAIFRNTITRETINRDVPLTRNYAGGGGDYVERHQTRETIDREHT